MLRPVRRFFELDAERRKLFLQACAQLGSVRFALRTRSFKDLTRGLTVHRSHFASAELDSPRQMLAQRIGWAVQAGSRYTPWTSSCLVQVLAAQRMLQQRSIPGVFYIGAAPGAGTSGAVGLEAHAWLKCGELFITGEAGHERYAVVTAFSWP